MGSLGQHLPAGADYHRLAERRWDQIGQRVWALDLDWPRVKVYQDGLPDAGPDVVQRILAEVQSPNYEILRWLVGQGAELIGSESPALLKEEYGHLQGVLKAKEAAARARAQRAYKQRAAALLAERDAYIARRIGATLPPGGVGLLFIGRAHRVAQHLPPDILVKSLPSKSK